MPKTDMSKDTRKILGCLGVGEQDLNDLDKLYAEYILTQAKKTLGTPKNEKSKV